MGQKVSMFESSTPDKKEYNRDNLGIISCSSIKTYYVTHY